MAAKGSPRRSTAQAVRASLLANATTTTLGWARLSSALGAHRRSGVSGIVKANEYAIFGFETGRAPE